MLSLKPKLPPKPKRPLPAFELLQDLTAFGYQKIIGIDEVGRGALAGPLIVTAVELNRPIDGITDSKLLTKVERERLATLIHQQAAQVSFGSVSVEEINDLGLSAATKLAYERALESIDSDLVLTDFVRLPGRTYIAQAQGDRYFYPTAAASIVAKVYRDQLMSIYHHYHPHYGWDKNAGYGTPSHLAAVKTNGPTSLHRLGFLKAGVAG